MGQDTDWTYCGHDRHWEPVYADGFSYCYLQTVSSLTLFCYSFLVLGTVSILGARQQATGRAQLAPSSIFSLRWLSWMMGAVYIVQTVYLTIRHGPIEIDIVTGVLHAASWLFALLPLSRSLTKRQPMHPASLAFLVISLVFLVLESVSFNPRRWYRKKLDDSRDDAFQVTILAARCFLLAAMLVITVHHLIRRFTSGSQGRASTIQSDETAVLLPDDGTHATKDGSAAAVPAGTVAQREGSTFNDISYRFKVIWPFLWPTRQRGLQLRVLVCLAMLAAGRVVNLYLPIMYKRVIDRLTPDDGDYSTVTFPADVIGLYVMLRFLSGLKDCVI